ncbi:MAG: ATP-binding protein [Trichlorobacter sp.]|jgi:MinD superfamily P-loop ATPase
MVAKTHGRAARIAIASGKGGTGKTTVSLNLAAMFGAPVQLADCDVEEPNLNLFLRCEQLTSTPVTMLIPEVDANRCTGCGACGELCQFRGIVSLGTRALVFPELCHGCGGCIRVCPSGAISENPHQIGTISVGQSRTIRLVEGRLEVGVSSVSPVIRAVHQQLRDDMPAILDAPPGTSCPVTATLLGADYVLLVTDPTPFGLHDLKLAVATARTLNLPCGVVINRAGEDQVGLYQYCQAEALPVLLSLPDDRQIAEITSRGDLVAHVLPEYGLMFTELADKLQQEVLKVAGGRA